MPNHELGRQIGYVIAKANRLFENDLENRLKPEGLNVDQYRILLCLKERGAIAMGELGERVLVEPANLTKIIDRMTQNGWVMRLPDDRDRRRVLVALSALGTERCEPLLRIALDHDAFARDLLDHEKECGKMVETLLDLLSAERLAG